jgi:acetyl esterase/lipase
MTSIAQTAPEVALHHATQVYREEPRLGPATPSQTAHLTAAHRLDVGPMPRVKTNGAASQRLGCTVGGVVDGLGFRLLRRLFSASHRADLEASDYYELEAGWLERSESVHEHDEGYFPRPAVPAVETTVRRELDGGVVVDLRFSSEAYADGRPTAYRMLREYPANRLARVRALRHRAPGHPALVWLHGWGMGFPTVEAFVCRARHLFRLGLDVYLYMLPFHAARRPPGVTFAGTVFPTTDMTRTNEGFLQAVWEVRALMAWHRARSEGAPCGVMGLSLGGYLAAVLASVAPETRFAVGLLPVADIPTLMWSNGEGTAERAWAEGAGVTFDMFCRSMAVHAPLARRLAIPRERVLLVGARGDRIIPPVHTEVLWEHWGRPRLHWTAGSHLAHFGRAGYLDAVEGLLREVL